MGAERVALNDLAVVSVLSAVRRVLGSVYQLIFRDRLRDIDQQTERLGSASVEAVTHLGSEVRALDQRLAAIERELMVDGFLLRYSTEDQGPVDGLPPGEGAFLACTFWLADNLALQGRRDEATEIYERLLGLCNDVGLLSEEYDGDHDRMVGNFPQAFSHLALVQAAFALRA